LAVADHKSLKSGQHVNYKPTIVSLGVLGTFIGIILGLWHFNLQNIAESLPQLLEGVTFAFLTSIMGMAVSILLSVLQAQPNDKQDTGTIMPTGTKQQLEQANRTLLAILTNANQQGKKTHRALEKLLNTQPEIKQQLEQIHQSLEKWPNHQPEIKQQLEQIHQSLEKWPNHQPEIKQQLDTIHQTLVSILDDVKQFKTTYQRYQRQHRFTKLGYDGQTLGETATQWAAIFDNETGLIWEVKTNDGGLQDSRHYYTWYDPKGNIVGKENGGSCQGCRCDTAAYREALNERQLAGSNNWHVPTIEELETLFKAQSATEKRYFPYVQPSVYCSATPYSLDNLMFWCLDFKTGQRNYNKGYGHLMLTSQYVTDAIPSKG
jgi:NAD-specific glutamate dehydrogenase